MGSDRAADRHGHHRSDPRISELCSAAASAGRHGFRDRVDAIRPRRSRCRSIRRCFRSTETPAGRRSRCSAAPSMRTAAQRRQSARWKWLRQPAKRFAFERRSRTGPDRSHRLQHQRRRTPPGFAFRPTPACKPPTPIRSIPCSTRSLRSRSIRSRRATRTFFRRIS